MHIIFMQFPVLDFELDHYVSEPFNSNMATECKFRPTLAAGSLSATSGLHFMKEHSCSLMSALHLPV